MMPRSKYPGKFIVIDGTDGSGKATQAKLLAEHFKKENKKVKTIDFPRYYNNFFGKFIGGCLAGDFGNFLEVSPYIASTLYAADRFESSYEMKKWLDEGYFVIADRYASSNQIHQGGKIKSKSERKKFLNWLEKMEFEVFKIPRPDLIIYLNVPLDITRKLLINKEKSRKKRYLKGKKDLHESNQTHLENAKRSALDLIKRFNNWVQVDCIKGGRLMTKKEISNLICGIVKKL